MENIQKTEDYKKFNILIGNRNIDKYHLKKLKNAIEKNNQLHLHPIIVNKNFEVIDGQHRLEAAKSLGFEIYYIKSDSVNDEHVVESNVNQKPFEVENYINYFCTRKNIEDYVELKKNLKITGLKPKALLTLILGNISGEFLNFLKTGKFRFPPDKSYNLLIDNYMNFIAYCDDKRIRPKSMFTSYYFTKAIRWLFLTSGFDFTTMKKKLDLRWFDLKPQRGSEEWYKLLISIYNFKNHNRIEEEYGKTH